MTTNAGKYTVRSVERAFTILKALRDNGEMRLIDVSRSTEINKGMAFKLLYTLCAGGLCRA